MMIQKSIAVFLFVFICVVGVKVYGQSVVSVSETTVEGMPSPTGVDPAEFRFGWKLISAERNQVQRAYEIKLFFDKTCSSQAWTSGVVKSSASINVKYSGKRLNSAVYYYWQVRVWDGKSKVSAWSKPARFITALRKQDWEDAKWIALESMSDSEKIVPGIHFPYTQTLGDKGKKRYPAPYFRREFKAHRKIKEAVIFISGMGHYELTLNGERVAKSFIAPGWTNYSKRSLYNTYDVTNLLTEGTNAIGITVGNGFFNINRERYFKLISAYGVPQTICKLRIQYDDNTTESVVTNSEWKACPSPTVYNSIYGGEDYDARLEQSGWDKPAFNDASWQNAIVVKTERQLTPEITYPVMMMESIPTTSVRKLSQNNYLYDFGQNASGVVRLKVKGKKGQTVKLSPAELIKDNHINQDASGNPFYFTYTLKGDEVEEWTPKFTYYGFRYVQVEGGHLQSDGHSDDTPEIMELTLEHNRNSTPDMGSFECSNLLFNQINELILWAIKSNMQSTLTDCPHREKLGWLEQDYLMGDAMMFNYDVLGLYRKITYDMIDSQRPNGLVPDIAPELVVFEDGFVDSPEWGSSSVIVPWLLYQNYGDDKILREAYPMMKRYVQYLKDKSQNNLLSHGLGDWFDYGPKTPGEAQLTPKTLTATAIYYYDLTLMRNIAKLLGNKIDASYFNDLATRVKDSFNKEFFNASKNLYSTGSQTALAMPLCVGLVDEEHKKAVVDNLVKTIRDSNNALTAGDIGFHFLVRALSDNNQSQVIFDMNARNDVPGYGYQLAKGATALTESWPALESVSNNHLMLGHIMEWFYNGILGITQKENSQGYKSMVIKPEIVGDITWAKGSFVSPYGNVQCNWQKDNNRLTVTIDVPVNTSTELILPVGSGSIVRLDGKILTTDKNNGVRYESGKVIIPVGSGAYSFSIEGFDKKL